MLVAYVGDFHIVPVEFLLDFIFVIDTVFEEPAALDFPAVVDAATGGETCNDEWNENFKRTKMHFIEIKVIV